MPTTRRAERFSQILHKRHGWLEAPPGYHFEERGKMILLIHHSRTPPDPRFWFPYGTAWRASSVLAIGN